VSKLPLIGEPVGRDPPTDGEVNVKPSCLASSLNNNNVRSKLQGPGSFMDEQPGSIESEAAVSWEVLICEGEGDESVEAVRHAVPAHSSPSPSRSASFKGFRRAWVHTANPIGWRRNRRENRLTAL
jgi:hypothetical protein